MLLFGNPLELYHHKIKNIQDRITNLEYGTKLLAHHASKYTFSVKHWKKSKPKLIRNLLSLM